MSDAEKWYLSELIQVLEEELEKTSSEGQIFIVNKELVRSIKNFISGLNDSNTLINYFIDYEEIFKGKTIINEDMKQQLKKDNINMIKSKLNNNFLKFCQYAWLQCELTIVLLIENYIKYKFEEFQQQVQTNCGLMIHGEKRKTNLDNYINDRKINNLWMSNKITICLLIIFRNPISNEEYKKLFLLLNALYQLRCIGVHREVTIKINERLEKIDDLQIKETAKQLYNEKSYQYVKDKVKFFICRASFWFPAPSKRYSGIQA